MKYDPQIHHRRSIRLKGYDYSQPGAYFVTLVAYQRQSLFGEILGGTMHLNQYGEILRRAWLDLPRHYTNAALNAFLIMPNHVHGIVVLHVNNGRGGSVSGKGSLPTDATSGEDLMPDIAQTRPYVCHGLPEIVRAFKSFSARRINLLRNTSGIPVWQRNYFEHVIRDESELNRIRQYIHDNPHKWAEDQENPNRSG